MKYISGTHSHVDEALEKVVELAERLEDPRVDLLRTIGVDCDIPENIIASQDALKIFHRFMRDNRHRNRTNHVPSNPVPSRE